VADSLDVVTVGIEHERAAVLVVGDPEVDVIQHGLLLDGMTELRNIPGVEAAIPGQGVPLDVRHEGVYFVS
jgi:hypothetical protein